MVLQAVSLPGCVSIQSQIGTSWLSITLEPSAGPHARSIHFHLETPGELAARRACVPPTSISELEIDAIIGIVRLLGGEHRANFPGRSSHAAGCIFHAFLRCGGDDTYSVCEFDCCCSVPSSCVSRVARLDCKICLVFALPLRLYRPACSSLPVRGQILLLSGQGAVLLLLLPLHRERGVHPVRAA